MDERDPIDPPADFYAWLDRQGERDERQLVAFLLTGLGMIALVALALTRLAGH